MPTNHRINSRRRDTHAEADPRPPNDRIIIIGENFNATRKIKATSPRVQEVDGRTGVVYTDLDGPGGSSTAPTSSPRIRRERHSFMIPHIAQALRNKDLEYITYAIKAQEQAGAHIIDLCVDEMSVYPEERFEWIAVPGEDRAVDYRLHRRHRLVGLQDNLRGARSP